MRAGLKRKDQAFVSDLALDFEDSLRNIQQVLSASDVSRRAEKLMGGTAWEADSRTERDGQF